MASRIKLKYGFGFNEYENKDYERYFEDIEQINNFLKNTAKAEYIRYAQICIENNSIYMNNPEFIANVETESYNYVNPELYEGAIKEYMNYDSFKLDFLFSVLIDKNKLLLSLMLKDNRILRHIDNDNKYKTVIQKYKKLI